MDKQGRKLLALILLVLVIGLISDGVMGAVGITSPTPTCGTTVHQCGTGTCVINNGSCLIDLLVTFSPTLQAIPSVVNARLNNTIGVPAPHSQTSTFQTQLQLPITSLTFQAEPSATWAAFPAAVTELYGQTQQRLFWASFNDTNGAVGVLTAMTANFCVSVVTGAAFGGQLRVQYSTDQTIWNTFGDAAFQVDITNPGFICTPEENNGATTFPLLAGNFFWRVIGQNGAGVDNPAFGTIQLSLRVTKYFLEPLTCYATVTKVVTTSHITVSALCNNQGKLTTPTQTTAFFVWEVWV